MRDERLERPAVEFEEDARFEIGIDQHETANVLYYCANRLREEASVPCERCPTCGSDDPQTWNPVDPGRVHPGDEMHGATPSYDCPDPYHRGGDDG